MKISKKIVIALIVICSFLGTLNLQTRIKNVEATEKTPTGVETIKNIEVPKGVELHQTLIVEDGVYVVGTSSVKNGEFNIGGTEAFPKIFVAKYTSDLTLEKLIDTGYRYEYESLNDRCTASECKEQDVVTLLHPGREALRFILQMKDNFLYVIGSHSTDKTIKMGCGVSCNLSEQERRIFVNKYNKNLDAVKGQTFGKEITEYIKEGGDEVTVNLRNYKALFMNDGIYIRYSFFVNRIGDDQGVLKINFDDISLSKNYMLEDSKRFFEEASVYDIMPYGNNIAILERREDEKEKAWYEYNSNLERQGEITKEIKNVTYSESESSEPALNDETFYLNSGKLYRSKTASTIHAKECRSSRCAREYIAGKRQFQDESGEVYSAYIEDNQNVIIQLLDADGALPMTKMKIPVTEDVASLSISGNNQKMAVSVNNKLYLLKKPQNQIPSNTNETCYQKSALSGSEVAFKHPKTNACYTIVTEQVESVNKDEVGLGVTQKVLKDGKEIFDIKSMDRFKEIGSMLVHPLLAVTDKGDLVISGIFGIFRTEYSDTYYTVVIDGETKAQKDEYIEKNVEPEQDSWKWWVSYQKMMTDGKNIIIAGTRTQRYEKENTPIASEDQQSVPFVLVLNENLVLEKVLLNDSVTKKYLNYHVSTIELTDRYIKTIMQSVDGLSTQMVIYDRESKKMIEEITNDVSNEVKTSVGSISLEKGKIIEKNNEGKIIKEQSVSVPNARITPLKINNNYIVASRSNAGKVVLYLIGDDGKEARKLETDVDIEETAVLIFDGMQTAFDKVSFYIVQKDGTAKATTVNATKIQAEPLNIVLIAGVTVGAVLLISATIAAVVIRRKKTTR